jgi:hypothetical protein
MFLQNYGNNLEDNKASHLSRSLALTDRNTGGIVASLIPELEGPSHCAVYYVMNDFHFTFTCLPNKHVVPTEFNFSLYTNTVC